MKASFSKILLPLLLIAVCRGGTSCNDKSKEPDSAQYAQLVGLWHAYEIVDGKKEPSTVSFRLHADHTAETYLFNEKTNYYQYSQCTCKFVNNWLTIDDQKERFYEKTNDILRCAAEFKEPQPEWTGWKILITSVSDNEIKTNINGHVVWLVRIDELPSSWPEGCSEPEKTATPEDLCCQWDLRSYYRLTGNNFHSWYLSSPETQGMILVENGGFANMQFFVNDLIRKEYNAGHLNAKDNIYVSFSDCAWAISATTFDFTCTGYRRIIADDYGTEIGSEYVQPENPFVMTYSIHTLTENWLTLYSSEDDYYFSFHRSLK